MPADFRVSITNARGRTRTPSPLHLAADPEPDSGCGQEPRRSRHFLQWMLADGQKFAAGLSYAPLPKEVSCQGGQADREDQ
jgi:phosphate transport system substrate-binding protein